MVDDAKLAALAKKCRESTGKNRAQVARELKVSRPAIFYAEEQPQKSLFELRKKIIESYSNFVVLGPEYRIKTRDQRLH